MYAWRSVLFLCTSALFGDFPTALQLWGATQRVLQPLWFAFPHKVQQAKGCCYRTVSPSSACCLALNQVKGRLFVEFHRLYFLFVALDASKTKLVSLSGSRSKVTLGEWKSDPENTAVCVCVFCVVSSHTHQRGGEKTDVAPRFIASCPRREESHLLEELCACKPWPWLCIEASICFLYSPSCCDALNIHSMAVIGGTVAQWLVLL